MIRFKPLVETRVDDVVATLEGLYAKTKEPVSARQIGDVVGMQSHQTLAYLHEAKDAGRANSVPTNNPNCTKGWVPGSVDVPGSPLKHGAKLVAATVGDLYANKPISGAAVARSRHANCPALARPSQVNASDQTTEIKTRMDSRVIQLAA
ncbi:MAG: hypothetical protein ACF8CQ_02540 [Rhodopirellula sp. JB044]|uniref:hypothetical protein n=1 Tax=Rhodopirellula sp. JB044 TaxID=3342844 RepID=UPI00370AEF3F